MESVLKFIIAIVFAIVVVDVTSPTFFSKLLQDIQGLGSADYTEYKPVKDLADEDGAIGFEEMSLRAKKQGLAAEKTQKQPKKVASKRDAAIPSSKTSSPLWGSASYVKQAASDIAKKLAVKYSVDVLQSKYDYWRKQHQSSLKRESSPEAVQYAYKQRLTYQKALRIKGGAR